METESKSRSHHRKRRERAQRLQPEPSDTDGDQDGAEISPSRGHKERSRSKPRKKKSGGAYEEDIIDGFAIVSFKSVDDLEKYTQGRLTHRSGEKCYENKKLHNTVSPARRKRSNKENKANKVQQRKSQKNNSLNEASSGETTDNLDDVELKIVNKPIRRLSDVSTISSSGAGYLCDSESGNERVSDTSLDIFKPVTYSNKHCQPGGPPRAIVTIPPVSTHSETITTATPTTTSITTDVNVTSIVTIATSSCVSLPSNGLTTGNLHSNHLHSNHLPSNSLTTGSVTTVTTAHVATVNTTSSSNNSQSHKHFHQHHSQNQHPHQVASSRIPQHHQQLPPTHHNHLPSQQQQQQFHHHQQQVQQQKAQQHHIHQSHQLADSKYDGKYSPLYHHSSNNNNSNSGISSNNNQARAHSREPDVHGNVNNISANTLAASSLPPSVIKRRPNSPPPLTRTSHPGSSSHPSSPYPHQGSTAASHLPPSSPSNRHRPYPPPVGSGLPQYPHGHSHATAITIPSSPVPPLSSNTPTPFSSSSSVINPREINHQRDHRDIRDRDIRDREAREREARDAIRKQSPTPSLRSKTPRREDSRDRDSRDSYPVLPPSLATTKSLFSLPGHGTGSLYSPLGVSPGLHPLHSTPPSHAPTFPGTAAVPNLPSPLRQHHQVLLNPQTASPHAPAMFAPPLPLGVPTAPIQGSLGAPAATHLPAEPLSSSDILREELNQLNRRFLISQERSPLLGSMPPLMRADIHQHMHQHQHQHQHMHQHTYQGGMPPPAISTPSLVPTPTPNPFEKLPSNPFIRQNLPSRPGIAEPAPRLLSSAKDKAPPIIPQHPRSGSIPGMGGFPSPLPDTLQTGVPGVAGAFQPKGLAGLHPAVGPLFIQGRELDKPTSHLPPAPPAPSTISNTPKKPGKWCAVHVRIAWEIYHHQQKQSADKPGSDLKPTPSHLLPGSSLPRPPDMATSAAVLGPPSILTSGRGMFESSPHNILNTSSHIPAAFPRPSPYSIGSSLPLALGNGLPSTSREPPVPNLASGSQDWMHHRTPPNFPTSAWSGKTEDREKELDRERELSLERRREEERERERRFEQERHRYPSIDDRNREARDRYRENDILAAAKSRSRSRSPMRNGRAESVKSDRSYERRPEETMLKVKEERRDSLIREDDHMSERERLLKNDYLASTNSLRTSEAFLQASMLDRARMMTPAAAYLAASERVPHHPALWNHFDKGPLDFQNHRLSLQREMEARDHLLNRFPGPHTGLPPGFPMPFEQERLREEMMLREKRDFIERLPVYERERLFYESSKIAGLRPPEHHLHPTINHSFPHNISPALHNHSKRTSPSLLAGVPPPLIHSVSAHNSRTHNSTVVNKTKGVSPTDSVGESKRDSNSNSTDPDAHSR